MTSERVDWGGFELVLNGQFRKGFDVRLMEYDVFVNSLGCLR